MNRITIASRSNNACAFHVKNRFSIMRFLALAMLLTLLTDCGPVTKERKYSEKSLQNYGGSVVMAKVYKNGNEVFYNQLIGPFFFQVDQDRWTSKKIEAYWWHNLSNKRWRYI